MAACDSTATQESTFEYRELAWGDIIYASKGALQEMGVGVGLAFPGEAGGPKRELNTTDPRGFKCKITDGSYRGNSTYCASIRFPDREFPETLGGWKHFARGVKRKASFWTDDFVGTAGDLVAAGLVPEGHFPGLPGMRKTTVTILPDGSIPNEATTSKHPDSRKPGAKCITRASGMKYCVSLYIDDELGELRVKAERDARDEWEIKMDSMPRPARIDGKSSERNRIAKLDYEPKTVAAWKKSQKFSFDVLRATVEDQPWLEELNSLFKYDAVSRMKILAKLNELERAIDAGVVLHKSVQEQSLDSNVINLKRPHPNSDKGWI